MLKIVKKRAKIDTLSPFYFTIPFFKIAYLKGLANDTDVVDASKVKKVLNSQNHFV